MSSQDCEMCSTPVLQDRLLIVYLPSNRNLKLNERTYMIEQQHESQMEKFFIWLSIFLIRFLTNLLNS